MAGMSEHQKATWSLSQRANSRGGTEQERPTELGSYCTAPGGGKRVVVKCQLLQAREESYR